MDRCARALASEILAKTVETAHNKASCDRPHLELGIAAGVFIVECGSIVCSVKSNNKHLELGVAAGVIKVECGSIVCECQEQ